MRTNKKYVEYVVINFTDILEIIIPFFDQYPLKNIKKRDFLYFKIICYKIMLGEGKRLNGIKKIISIRNHMNAGGNVNRKYTNI